MSNSSGNPHDSNATVSKGEGFVSSAAQSTIPPAAHALSEAEPIEVEVADGLTLAAVMNRLGDDPVQLTREGGTVAILVRAKSPGEAMQALLRACLPMPSDAEWEALSTQWQAQLAAWGQEHGALLAEFEAQRQETKKPTHGVRGRKCFDRTVQHRPAAHRARVRNIWGKKPTAALA